MNFGQRFLWAAAAILVPALAAAAYPEKPITMIVPFPPGGPTDAVARLVGQRLSLEMGQSIIIDNRGGAGGVLATNLAATAKPDGYTIFFATTGTMAINPTLYKDTLKVDPLKAFVPIGTASSSSSVLVVNKDAPYRTVQDVIAAARATPGALTFASSGNGGVIHLTGELFRKAAGIKIEHIPYKGSAPALTDLMGGRVTMMFDLTPGSMPFIQSGRLKALAVTNKHRVEGLPGVPTVAESGLPNFEVTNWVGLVAPKGVPQEVITRLSSDLQRVLSKPEVQKQLSELGSEVLPGTPGEFAALLKSDAKKWSELVKASGASID